GGYRHSWECAVGQVTEQVFVDNTKSWSGDHCVDPSIVPGVFFCNRAIVAESPRLVDVPASVLRLFGQPVPGYRQGEMLVAEGSEDAPVRGMLDPTTLSQSGAAPGALVLPREERRASTVSRTSPPRSSRTTGSSRCPA
ncbi:MAG TPA: hypothetical protein VLA62_11660, partial [Solirubrobacterales bacterium]|nr:hypothetical protein [Solirubrobacterales bacterium]